MRAHMGLGETSYNGPPLNTSREDSMGTTLYNRIYLGRGSRLATRRMQAALALGALAGAGLVWAAMRAMK